MSRRPRKPRAAAKPAKQAAPVVSLFSFVGQTFAVVSIALAPVLPPTLTAAERDVVAQILQGKSNAAIARARGVAVRTVANQVASILKKLRVGSRAALIARLTRAAADR